MLSPRRAGCQESLLLAVKRLRTLHLERNLPVNLKGTATIQAHKECTQSFTRILAGRGQNNIEFSYSNTYKSRHQSPSIIGSKEGSSSQSAPMQHPSRRALLAGGDPSRYLTPNQERSVRNLAGVKVWGYRRCVPIFEVLLQLRGAARSQYNAVFGR